MKVAHVMGGDPWGSIDASLPERGCGGRERAVVELSLEWARKGHDVTCFVHRDEQHPVSVVRFESGQCAFVPFENALGSLRGVEFDAVVTVELPELFMDAGVMARQERAARVVHHQVAHVHPGIVDELHGTDPPFVWGCLSRWHARFLMDQGCRGDIAVLPNGCEMGIEPALRDGGPPRFVYSSSPDRGLSHLNETWPVIEAEVPGAVLSVAYGITDWAGFALASHGRDAEDALDVKELVEMPGVENVGLVGKAELRDLQSRAHALLYPCDTKSPTETGCITVLESLAAGMLVHTTDCDCLEEEYGSVATVTPLPWDAKNYANAVLDGLHEDVEARRAAGIEFASARTWEVMASRWLELFDTNRT